MYGFLRTCHKAPPAIIGLSFVVELNAWGGINWSEERKKHRYGIDLGVDGKEYGLYIL
jgi:hypothetical protein